MNINVKILNKLSANQVQQHLQIYHNQERFIPGMQERFKICKSTNVFHHINRTDKNHIIISINEKKIAFEKLQHPLMIKYLGEEGTVIIKAT